MVWRLLEKAASLEPSDDNSSKSAEAASPNVEDGVERADAEAKAKAEPYDVDQDGQVRDGSRLSSVEMGRMVGAVLGFVRVKKGFCMYGGMRARLVCSLLNSNVSAAAVSKTMCGYYLRGWFACVPWRRYPGRPMSQ